MWGLRGAVRLQCQIVASDRGYLNEIIANPFFAVIFLGVIRAARRDDLTSFALVAPILITMWGMALEISGDVVASDRWTGTLEQVIATPTPLTTVVFGRVLAVSMLSAVAMAETWLVARLGFGIDVVIHHPLVLGSGLVVTSVAMTGTAVVMAGAFVLVRTARIFQNTMNYPIYLLAGVLVPISFLPEWMQPVSRAIFLSWSADLLRDALQPAPVADVAPRLAVILALGVAGFVVGRSVLAVVLRRVRALGTLGYV